jgi:glycosyltransferase involved in cell wall biosynthesis
MKINYDGSFLMPAQIAGGIARDSEDLLVKFSKKFEMQIFYPERYFLRKNEHLHKLKLIKLSQKIASLVLSWLHSSSRYSNQEIYWQSQPGIFIPPRNSIWILRLHDLFPITHPKDYSLVQRKIFARSVEAAVSRAIILVNSSHTKKQLELRYGKDIKIFTVPCSQSKFKKFFCNECSLCLNKFNINDRFILTVGTLFKRRNLKRLIQFSSNLFYQSNLNIKVVGRFTSPLQRSFLKIKTRGKNIEFLGAICDGQLEQMYHSAVAYLTFSKEEGFNIPLLDAIYREMPILASDIPTHRELIKNENCFDEKTFLEYFKSSSQNLDLFKVMRPLLKDDFDQLIVFIENLTHA